MTWVWTHGLLFTWFLQVNQSIFCLPRLTSCWSSQAAEPGSQLLIGVFFFFCTSGCNILFSAPQTLNLLDQGLLLSTDRWNISVNLWCFTRSDCFSPTSTFASWFCPTVELDICSLGAIQGPGGWFKTGRLDESTVGDRARKPEALNQLLTVCVSWLFFFFLPFDCSQLPELHHL